MCRLARGLVREPASRVQQPLIEVDGIACSEVLFCGRKTSRPENTLARSHVGPSESSQGNAIHQNRVLEQISHMNASAELLEGEREREENSRPVAMMEKAHSPKGFNFIWKDLDKLRVSPFHIADNLYWVGNHDVSCHLVATTDGAILIDTGFGATVPLLVESIQVLGFTLSDIRYIVNTHGHEDHCGGNRRMVELTGAKTCIHERDVETVEKGTPLTCAYYMYGIEEFQTFKVDVPLKDGDVISLGGRQVEVLHTPGHTPGGCTFRMRVEMDGRKLWAVLWGCPGQWAFGPEHRSQGYPGDFADYARSLERLWKLEVDIPLAAHPGQYKMFDKADRARAGEKPNPFIDPEGWTEWLRLSEESFQKLLGQVLPEACS